MIENPIFSWNFCDFAFVQVCVTGHKVDQIDLRDDKSDHVKEFYFFVLIHFATVDAVAPVNSQPLSWKLCRECPGNFLMLVFSQFLRCHRFGKQGLISVCPTMAEPGKVCIFQWISLR